MVPEHQHISVEQLKRDHFEQSPVWAFCLESEGAIGIDESTVRPADLSELGAGSYGSYLVSASYSLKGKQVLPGAVQLDVLGRKVAQAPAFLFLLDRHLDAVSMETDRLLSRHTKFPGNTPKSWQLKVMLPNESRPRSGLIRKSFGFHLASLVISLGRSVLKRRMKKHRGTDA